MGPRARVWRGVRRALRAAWRRPRRGLVLVALAGPAAWLPLNWGYQVVRQPAELPGLVGSALVKTPRGTWESYGSAFRAHATPIITPELLAALAHAESGGSPLARPGWRWRWSWNPFAVYGPASSATGLFQLTDGTFAAARRYCIRGDRVAEVGPWHDLDACWFPWSWSRLVPGHAVELTAAYLDVAVRELTAARARRRTTAGERETLAAVVHLCGRQRAASVLGRDFRLDPGERCGSHDLREYLGRVRDLRRQFARLAAGETPALTPTASRASRS
jgi:hypothetical protein